MVTQQQTHYIFHIGSSPYVKFPGMHLHCIPYYAIHRKLQWYVIVNMFLKIALNQDLEVPYIAEHIRNLAQSFDSKILGAENLLIRQLGRYLFYPRDE